MVLRGFRCAECVPARNPQIVCKSMARGIPVSRRARRRIWLRLRRAMPKAPSAVADYQSAVPHELQHLPEHPAVPRQLAPQDRPIRRAAFVTSLRYGVSQTILLKPRAGPPAVTVPRARRRRTLGGGIARTHPAPKCKWQSAEYRRAAQLAVVNKTATPANSTASDQWRIAAKVPRLNCTYDP